MNAVLFLCAVITIATGLWCLRRRGPVVLWLVLGNVMVSLAIEQSVSCWSDELQDDRNIIYNIYSFIDIAIWLIVFYRLFHQHTFLQRFVRYVSVVIFTTSVLEIVWRGPGLFHSMSFMVFNASMMLLSISYMISLLKREYQQLSKDAGFWLSAAVLCFHGLFFVNLSTMFDPDYWTSDLAGEVFHFLQNSAQLIYHLFICLAFLTARRFSLDLQEHW